MSDAILKNDELPHKLSSLIPYYGDEFSKVFSELYMELL